MKDRAILRDRDRSSNSGNGLLTCAESGIGPGDRPFAAELGAAALPHCEGGCHGHA